MTHDEKLEAFRTLVERHQVERFARDYPHSSPPTVRVKPGRRWTKVDIGSSGAYVVDQDGRILGIKAYGVPHHGHRYGTLDTIDEWDWSGYRAVRV